MMTCAPLIMTLDPFCLQTGLIYASHEIGKPLLCLCSCVRRVTIVQMNRITLPVDTDVEHLDEYRKAHRKVDVTLRNVNIEGFDDQIQADEKQKTQRQHFDRRMFRHEAANRRGEPHHEGDRYHHRTDHYPDVINHSDRSDN